MKQELQEIYDYYLGLTPEQRVNAVKEAGASILEYLAIKNVPEDTASILFVAFFAIFIDADKKVSDEELALFNNALDVELSKEELERLVNQCSNPQLVQRVDEIVDSMPFRMKSNVIVIGLALISADGDLSSEEIEIFEKILA